MSEIRQVHLKESLLKVNDYMANELREKWTKNGTFVVNLLSSPGSGKTSLLEHCLPKMKDRYRILVLEGDLETERDADRVRGVGVEAIQLTTGGACHLEAHQIQQAWEMLDSREPYDFVFIENVGNLVCPASYDLGEHLRVVLLSVPEGEDKPPKYPKAFRESHACVITKVDLLPHFDFRVEEVTRLVHELRPGMPVLQVAATKDQGVDEWIAFLEEQRRSLMVVG